MKPLSGMIGFRTVFLKLKGPVPAPSKSVRCPKPPDLPAQGLVIPAGILGKIKTVSQMVFSILIMLGLFISEFVELEFGTFSFVSNILLWITAVLTVISGVKYIVDGKKVIDFSM